jgi:predicted dehydrogenase
MALLGEDSGRARIGVGLVGFGWLGHAHSRSILRIPTLFPDRGFDAVPVVVGDPVEEMREEATGSFGFRRATADWQEVIADPEVDVVYVAAPNRLHVEVVEAAAAAGKAVFCEKPVGGTPDQAAEAERAAAEAGVASGVGYNFRWAPLVQHARELIESGVLGEVTNYRGRFFSMYGSDPMGPLSWRYLVEEGGYGATSDLLSHSVDLSRMLIGPISRVVGTTETFIRERPVPAGPHAGRGAYGRGGSDDPMGKVTNEDYAGMLCIFENGARGTFETSRSMIGPESQMAFDVYGTEGALSWNFERMNELRVYRRSDRLDTGYTTVFSGDRFPFHGSFVPGSANGIGYEDLVTIEDYEFLRRFAAGEEFSPSLRDALAWAEVQEALLRSNESGRWEEVKPLPVEAVA